MNSICNNHCCKSSESSIKNHNTCKYHKSHPIRKSCNSLYKCCTTHKLTYHLGDKENYHQQGCYNNKGIRLVSCFEIPSNSHRTCFSRHEGKFLTENTKHQKCSSNLNTCNPGLTKSIGYSCCTRTTDKRTDACIGRHCCHGKNKTIHPS